MQKLVFINGAGNEIDLTAGNFGIVNWAGLSNTSLNIQTQQVPFEDGGVFLDALMEQREIEVTVAIYDGNNLELRYQKKRELISALNPKLGEGTLIYTNDYLSRQIHAVPQIPLFENKNSNDVGTLKASVAFSCCNPYWEDVEPIEVILKTNQPVIIQNNGEVPAQLNIEIYTNNAVNPSIERMNDNKKITYNGNLNKSLFISTLSGNKQVYTEDINFKNINLATNINDLCYSTRLGMFIGVASGVLYYSYGGNEWKTNVASILGELNGICYSNEIRVFIAVGNSGKVITSSNGLEWILQTSNISVNLNKIIYSDIVNMFVAVGDSGTIITSSDGINWVSQTSGTSENLKDIVYSEEKELFVAVGEAGLILSSTDGETWDIQTSGTSSSINAIAYSDKLNIFLAVSTYGNYLTSTDGVSWTLAGIGDPYTLNDVVYSDFLDTFIVTMNTGFYISKNLSTWTYKSLGAGNTALYTISVTELKLIVMAGKSIYASQDGINTIRVTNGITSRINKMIYSEKHKLFVGVCDEGKIITSIDGSVWETSYLGYSNTSLLSVVYSEKQDLFVAIGAPNWILTSTDGINWQEQSYSIGGTTWNDIIYSDKLNLFVIVGGQGEIKTSFNGINWFTQTSPTSVAIKFIYYYEKSELFVIVGNGVWYSSNGINWQSRGDNTLPKSTNAITYAKSYGLYIAIGASVLTSPDGITWQVIIPALSYVMNNIAYSDELNMFIATNTNGVILISQDIENWTLYNLDITIALYDVLYSDKYNMFLVSGNSGAIFNSDFFELENQIQNITNDSSMDLALLVGNNTFRITRESGITNARITFRQKYIGV